MTKLFSRLSRPLRTLALGGCLLVPSFILSACHPETPAYNRGSMRIPPQVIAGWKAVLGAENVQMLQYGWQLRIILPADNLFKVGSTRLTAPASDILAQIAYYLRVYAAYTNDPYPIKIVGHTDITYSKKGAIKRSKQYAQIVASFMWHHGVPSKRIKIEGVGASQPIARSSMRGMAKNRRVTILVH